MGWLYWAAMASVEHGSTLQQAAVMAFIRPWWEGFHPCRTLPALCQTGRYRPHDTRLKHMADSPTRRDETVAEHIQRYGWHCLHVQPDHPDQVPFSYTIGFNQCHQAPEVMVFNMPRDRAHALLSACAAMLAEGHRIQPDIRNGDVLSGGYDVIFKRVDPRFHREYLGTALRHAPETPLDAVVMFLPDADHRYPWEDGYAYVDVSEALGIV